MGMVVYWMPPPRPRLGASVGGRLGRIRPPLCEVLGSEMCMGAVCMAVGEPNGLLVSRPLSDPGGPE